MSIQQYGDGDKLIIKLRALLSILNISIARIEAQLEFGRLSFSEEGKLLRIKSNLENTRSVCCKALENLQGQTQRRRLTPREYQELGTIEEVRKFKYLPPITRSEIQMTNLNELFDQLGDL